MERIREYAEQLGLSEVTIQQRMAEFARHADLAEEFEAWIRQGQGIFPNGIKVEGYTAKKINELAPFMNGVGVYNFLINLRENPKIALGYIEEGFPVG